MTANGIFASLLAISNITSENFPHILMYASEKKDIGMRKAMYIKICVKVENKRLVTRVREDIYPKTKHTIGKVNINAKVVARRDTLT